MSKTAKPLLYRPPEAALGISKAKLYALMSAGEIPFVMVGKSKRIPVKELEQMIAERLEAARA